MLQALDDEIVDQRSVIQDRNDDADRERVLEQKRKDLAQAKMLAQRKQQDNTQISEKITVRSSSGSPEDVESRERKATTASQAADQWKHQKSYENASNEYIDRSNENGWPGVCEATGT